MDFNAGVLLEQPMEVILESFVQKIIAVASGEETKNEQNDVREIAILKRSNTLIFIKQYKKKEGRFMFLSDDFY